MRERPARERRSGKACTHPGPWHYETQSADGQVRYGVCR